MTGRNFLTMCAGVAAALSLAPSAFAASPVPLIHRNVARVQMSGVDGDTGACAVQTAGAQREFIMYGSFVLGRGVRTCQQTVAALPAAYRKMGVLAQSTAIERAMAKALDRAPVKFSAHGAHATVTATATVGSSRETITYGLLRSGGKWLVAGESSQSSVS